MSSVLIVDYGLCNLDSVSRAIEECGGSAFVTNQPSAARTASRIILPGVGSFTEGMRSIREMGWDKALTEEVLGSGIPILGICLGMQLLASQGVEGGGMEGLGFIPGQVVRLEKKDEERIPHIGWNEVHQTSEDIPIFEGIPQGKDFYFVHSYHFCPEDRGHVLATTPYCGSFVSAVGSENILGTQFHPEKSLGIGFQLLKNFLKHY
jgi:glutamine amidotransferase